MEVIAATVDSSPSPRVSGKVVDGVAATASRLLLVLLLVVTPPLAAHVDASDRIHLLSHRIEETPGDASLFLQRALAWLERGAFAHALEDVARARELGGDEVSVALVQARALLGSGQPQAAEEVLDTALRLAPTDGRLLRLRAGARRTRGDRRGACADLRVVLAISPRPSPALVLELVRDLRATGRSGEALGRLDDALERIGPSSVLRREVLALEIGLGRIDDALARLDRWTASDPLPARWWIERARLLEEVQRPDAAQGSWQAAADALVEQRQGLEGRRLPALDEMAAQIAAGVERTRRPREGAP